MKIGSGFGTFIPRWMGNCSTHLGQSQTISFSDPVAQVAHMESFKKQLLFRQSNGLRALTQSCLSLPLPTVFIFPSLPNR